MKRTVKHDEEALLKEGAEWEKGARGRESKIANIDVDKRSGLQLISIRIPSDIIDRLKQIAGDHGIGYQPYVRRLLVEHVKQGPNAGLEKRVERLEKEVRRLHRSG